MHHTIRAIAAALVLFAAACAPVPRADAAPLPVEEIVIDTATGPHPFRVEMALDDASQERGLMYRREMAPDAGMLFDFRRSQIATFWMKNTVLPLDMLFVRADGTIAAIQENAVPYSLANISSGVPVRVVIEINGGRARALGIRPGGVVRARLFGNLAAAPN